MVEQKSFYKFANKEKKTSNIMAIGNGFTNIDQKDIYPRRLIIFRKMRGMSQAQLAKRLEELEAECNDGRYKSVSSTALEKYEKGIMLPQDEIKRTIADALDIPIEDFDKPFDVNIDCSKFAFRKKSRLGKKKQEEIVLAIQNRIEKYVEVERMLNINTKFDGDLSNIVVTCDVDARKAAMKLRKDWSLGLGPIPQSIQVLENHGVKVIAVNEDPTLFDGTSNTIEGIPVLVINMNYKDKNNPDIERRRFTLFHELGHQVLKFGSDVDDKTQEHLCDVFANEMLIPQSTFLDIFGNKRQNILIGELKSVQQQFGISCRALMMKAKQLGVVTESSHKYFCIRINQNADLKAFVDRNAMQEMPTTRFERLVYRALAMKEIDTSKAATLLGLGAEKVKEDLNFVF